MGTYLTEWDSSIQKQQSQDFRELQPQMGHVLRAK